MEMRQSGDDDADKHFHVQPLIRWAGSKRQALSRLAGYWRQSYRRYVEPFAGSASLFFRLAPSRALLSDINPELIDAYKTLQERPDSLYNAVVSFPTGEEAYYEIRDLSPHKLRPLERAARFVYLNRYCFNGIYRTNRQGRFNVPYGGSKSGALPSIESFRKCALLLQRARVIQCDYGHTLSQTRSGDFVYLDPPYVVASRRIFREYGPRHFQLSDLQRLAGHLVRMDNRGVVFVVSYADCSEARELFRRWRLKRVPVRRHIAGFAASRRNAYELIATNAKA